MPFLDSLDVGNRALQLCGLPEIVSVTEDSQRNREISAAYDKVRRAELRRNVWRYAIRKVVLRPVDTGTMLLKPALWSAAATYLRGSIVSDGNGLLWISTAFDNVNNQPGTSGASAYWDMYFGPMSISLFDSGTIYSTGELVYVAGANPGSYGIYMSLQNANTDVPNVATAYDPTATYTNDNVVSSGGSQWRCLLPFVIGVTPADGPLAYDPTATYAASDTVTGSDGFIYSSVSGSNTGHDPVTDGGIHWTNTTVAHAWTRSPTLAVSSEKWLALNATMEALTLLYPIGAGPASQASSRNVYRLPAGFLREAPQNPTLPGYSSLGAPGGIPASTLEYDGNFIITDICGQLSLRFVADISRVTSMDDMFCEGLACRVAEAVCQRLTQSDAKLAGIEALYKKYMGDARTVNGIEEGSISPPDDEFLVVRL